MCGQKRRPVKPRINLWTVVTQEGYSLSGNISIMLGTRNTQGRYQKRWQFNPSLESLFAFQKSNMWIRYKKTLRFLVSAGSIFVSDSGIPPIPSSDYNGILITPQEHCLLGGKLMRELSKITTYIPLKKISPASQGSECYITSALQRKINW